MKTTLACAILALLSLQVSALIREPEPEDPYKAPMRTDPSLLTGCDLGIENCDKCYNPDLECSQCANAYYRTLDWQRCLSCPSNCAECTDSNQDDVTECTKCKVQYYRTSDKKCSWCNGHCDVCSEDWQCNSCEDRYYLMSPGKGDIRSCRVCTDNCYECTDSSFNGCRVCADSYYRSSSPSGYCIRCAAGCALCKDGTSCDKCEAGKTWTGVSCTSCISQCKTCDTSAGCQECNSGYSLASDASVCYSCTNCDDCPAKGGCQKCEYGYILKDFECWACPSIDTSADCNNCGNPDGTMGRYYDTADSTCKFCPVNAVSCSSPTVATCLSNMYFDGSACLACDANCKTCSAGSSSSCTACSDDKYLTGSSTCVLCSSVMTSCAECSSGTVCTKCTSGKYIDENDATNCISCPTTAGLDFTVNGCKQCGSTDSLGKSIDTPTVDACQATCLTCDGPGTTDCTSCAAVGEFLATDGTCTPCATGCLTCTSTTNCQKCTQAQVFDRTVGSETCTATVGTNTSPSSGTLDANSFYDDSGTVVSCADTFYLTGGVCTACGGNCATCDGTAATDCLSCATAFYVDSTGACTACGGNCATCDGTAATDCLSCATSFYVDSTGACTACGGNCLTCDGTAATDCLSCATAFYLDSTGACTDCTGLTTQTGSQVIAAQCDNIHWRGTCMDCPAGCAVCNVASGVATCSSCAAGKYLDAGVCKDANCDSPGSVAAECTVCDGLVEDLKYRYVTSLLKCIKCPINCASCNDQGQCLTCKAGFLPDSTGLFCTDCFYDEDIECVDCGSSPLGRYLDSSDSFCKVCPSGCKYCNSPTECTTCYDNYYLDTSSLCQPCVTGSSDQTICDACKTFYTPNLVWDASGAGVCSACPVNCIECDAVNTCTKCAGARYWDTTDVKCNNCPQSCSECGAKDTCSLCNTNKYFDDTSKKCVACDSKCTDCETAAGCKACQTGYYLTAEKTCRACNADIPLCLACPSSSSCSFCGTGKFFDSATKTCSNCIDGCATCIDAVTCSQCVSGKCYDESGPACRDTSGANCATCELNAELEVSCLTCTNYYHLRICKSCDVSFCAECKNDYTKCEMCSPGFFYDSDANTCNPCPGYPNCNTCNLGDTVCNSCKEGTFWDDASVSCKACGLGCKSCPNLDSCTCASENMFWDPTPKKCTPCMNGCKKCKSSDKCTECYGPYIPIKDVLGVITECRACTTGCSTCSLVGVDEENICSMCYEGYFLRSDGTCEACAASYPDCISCSDDDGDDAIGKGECYMCIQGALSDDRTACRRCSGISGCVTCNDFAPMCVECSADYYQTADNYQCGFGCWDCKPEDGDCNVAPSMNTSYIIGCPGMSVTEACWVMQLENDEGVISHRGCGNETCSDIDRVEYCQDSATGGKECSICCDSNLCNSEVLIGQSAGAFSINNGGFLFGVVMVTLTSVFNCLRN